MTLSRGALSTWIEALIEAVQAQADGLLPFDLLAALLACDPPAVVETWVARQPVAFTRSALWSAHGDLARAAEAALAAPHPLPAIALLRAHGDAVAPAVITHLGRFAERPGEWYQGAHAVLAEALAARDPEAAARHLEIALREPPRYAARVAEHASAMEAAVRASALARRLAALGREDEAEAFRAAAVDRMVRALRAERGDEGARFDLAEEDGIGDPPVLFRAVLDEVLAAAGPMRLLAALGEDGGYSIRATIAAALATAGRLDEARAVGEGPRVDAEIAAASADPRLPLVAAAEIAGQWEDGLLTAGERAEILCAAARAHGRCGRPEEGRAMLAPVIEEARDGWPVALPRLRDALAAARSGAVLAPPALFAPVTEQYLAFARKRVPGLRPARLLAAAASRPGSEGLALLEEALACEPDRDLEERESPFAERWLAAYAVHGRLDDAQRVADRMHGDLAYSPGYVHLDGVCAHVLALHAAGREEEAERELGRWLPLPASADLVAAVLAVGAQRGELPALAAQLGAAVEGIDAGIRQRFLQAESARDRTSGGR